MDLIIDNIEEAIVKTKKQLKQNLPDLKGIFKEVESCIAEEVSIIQTLIADGKEVIPDISYKDIEDEKVNQETIHLIKKRGCIVIRNIFSKSQIDEWNEQLLTYHNRIELELPLQSQSNYTFVQVV